MLKKIVAADKTRTGKLFSELLLSSMDEDSLECLVTCNRGQFLLVSLLECGVERVVEQTRAKVATLKKTLGRQKTKGAEVLKKKMGW